MSHDTYTSPHVDCGHGASFSVETDLDGFVCLYVHGPSGRSASDAYTRSSEALPNEAPDEVQPLSDDEIMELARPHSESFRWPSSAIDIARAIERRIAVAYAPAKPPSVGTFQCLVLNQRQAEMLEMFVFQAREHVSDIEMAEQSYSLDAWRER
jgi:hypothetical protein